MDDERAINGGHASRASLTRLERTVDRLDGKMDAYTASHSDRHDRERADIERHLREAAVMAETVRKLVIEQGQLDVRLVGVEVWRAELRGAFRLGQLAFGTSILSAITAIAALVGLLTGAVR